MQSQARASNGSMTSKVTQGRSQQPEGKPGRQALCGQWAAGSGLRERGQWAGTTRLPPARSWWLLRPKKYKKGGSSHLFSRQLRADHRTRF